MAVNEGAPAPYFRQLSAIAAGGTPPTPEDRLAFLRRIQRLLKEGDFTATYKFALLQALLDLSVESRAIDRAPLPLTWRQLAEKFIAYYWNHTEPYRPRLKDDGILVQSNGRQAAVVTHIAAIRRSTGAATLSQLRRNPAHHREYAGLVRSVQATVRNQPVRYIQNLNGGRDEFLFTTDPDGGGITLKQDVAWCLQEFYDLIQGQVQARWVEQVRTNRQNSALIGSHKDLELFLFGNQRIPLAKIGDRLRDIDGARCFYCDSRSHGALEVDHFIPWARYPRDLGHNFVLAHAGCNHSKRDTLASTEHFAHWTERLTQRGAEVGEALSELVVCDHETSLQVARWAYRRDIDAEAGFWRRVRERRPEYCAHDATLVQLAGLTAPV